MLDVTVTGHGRGVQPRTAAALTPGGRPLRVAHLTTVDLSLALLLRTELEEDVAAGFSTFGVSAPGPFVGAVEALGVQHVPVPSLSRSWSLRQDLAAAREIALALRRIRPDVLHTHNPKTGVIGRVLGRALGVPVVVNTCHGLWATEHDRLRKRFLVYGVEALAAQFSHAELYQNDADRQTLHWLVRARKTRLVGNGTDLERFGPDPGRRNRVRSELGVRPDQVLVGGIGRLVTEKGIGEFVAVAEELRDRAVFVWAGGEDSSRPGGFRTTSHGADPVRFLGERADMEAVHNALDVFVLPSYREGMSRSAMEAAASGTAMVLTDIRGCREIGRHEQELLLVPPRNSTALTAAVARLLEDEVLRARLGQAAQRRAREAFDQRRVAATSLATYRSVAQRRKLGWTGEVTS